MKKLLAILLLLFTAQSDAAFHGSFTPFPQALQRSQVNLGGGGFSYWETNLLLEQGGNWTWGNGLGFAAPDKVDANGYPLYEATASTHGGWGFARVRVPFQYARTGNFVLTAA